MRIKPRRGSWILAVLFAFVFAFPSSSKATSEPGLQVTIYDNYGYNESPPLPSVSGRPVQCTTTYLSIDQNFGNSICGLYDDYIVKYEGYITSPTTETITFYPSADDGTKLYIDNLLVDDNWVDKGGGGNPSAPIEFIAGVPKPITLWFYENGGGNWVELAWNQGGGYSTVPAEAFTQNNESQYTTTTTAAPYLNSVTNLVATANADGSVDLDWDAPTSSNVDIYAYGVTFYGLDEIGGTTSGGWGVWTNQGTTYSLAEYMFSGTTGFGPVRFGIKAGNESCFSSDGVGPCVYGPETNIDVLVIDPTPPTTTTTEPEQTTTSTSTTVPSTTIPETTTTSSSTTTTVAKTTTTQEVTTTTIKPVAEIVPPEITTTTTTTQPQKLTTPVTTTSTTVPTTTTTTSTTQPLLITTTTVPTTVVILSQNNQEKIDKIIQNPNTEEALSLISSENLNSEQVKELVDVIIQNEISTQAAQQLASSPEVIQNITGDQASEVFGSIQTSQLTEEDKSEITNAVQDAPEEVKNAFEAEINIYAEGFDDYVPVGSSVDVSSRRTLLAATAVLSAATVGVGAGTGSSGPSGGSGGSGGGSGGSGGGSGGSGGSGGGPGDGNNKNGRKEDENLDGEEEDTEIEGPEDQEDNHFTRNSIFKYEEETMKRRFSPWGFIKKLGRETSALAFTISGSVVVFATLSGETRKITVIATGCAFAVHYIYAMMKNDED
jgi:uncharacterized membrane protein YgcG